MTFELNPTNWSERTWYHIYHKGCGKE